MSYDHWKTTNPADEFLGDAEQPGKPRIKTVHEYPPIPIRDFDWCAYLDGEEERGEYGYGRTEAEAIADFLENYGEDQ
jgi:hypothetical protein